MKSYLSSGNGAIRKDTRLPNISSVIPAFRTMYLPPHCRLPLYKGTPMRTKELHLNRPTQNLEQRRHRISDRLAPRISSQHSLQPPRDLRSRLDPYPRVLVAILAKQKE